MALRGILKGVGWSTLAPRSCSSSGLSPGLSYLWSHRPGQVAGRIARTRERTRARRGHAPDDRARERQPAPDGHPLRRAAPPPRRGRRVASACCARPRCARPTRSAASSAPGASKDASRCCGPRCGSSGWPTAPTRIPTFRKGKGGGAPIEISDIEIRDGRLQMEASQERRLDPRSRPRRRASAGERQRADHRLRGAFVLDAPRDTVTSLRGIVRLVGDRVFFEPLHVRTNGSEIEANGPLGLARRRRARDRSRARAALDGGGEPLPEDLAAASAGRNRAGAGEALARGDGPLAGAVERGRHRRARQRVALQRPRRDSEQRVPRARPPAPVRADRGVPAPPTSRFTIARSTGSTCSSPASISRVRRSGLLEGDLPPTDLGGHVILTGRGFGTGVTDLDVQAEVGPGRVDLLEIDGGRALFHILPDKSFAVDSAEVAAGGGFLRAQGASSPKGDIVLDAEADAFRPWRR